MTKKLFILIALFASVKSIRAQAPTWADDVACIVYSHCTSCHNNNGAAPFSLLTYNNAVAYASSIRHVVENNEMPPWPIDNSYRKMAHSRNLSEAEKITLLAWINTGKTQGNMSNAPAEPVYNSNEVITNPDLVIKLPTYTVPSITEDLYRCFVVPTGQSVQKFITGIEIIPGNRNIVHHAQVFYDTTGTTTTLDNNDPAPGYTSAGGVGTNAAVLLGTWVPGASPILIPPGLGKRLPPTAKLVVQIHYPEYASGEKDSTRLNFLFTSNTVRNISDAPVLNHNTTMTNGPLFIPKNTVKTFYQQFFVPMNATILSIGPHGHLLCKSMKAFAVTLNNDTIPLVHIPRWDFHWQGTYDFQKPIRIPFGAKLFGEATYDNTVNNPDNPNDPPEDVSVGEATTDEMMIFYFSYMPYQNGDENIVIDTASHPAHHEACVTHYNSALKETAITEVFSLYPNPAGDILNFAVSGNDFSFSIYNATGVLVSEGRNAETLDISDFAKGIYSVHINRNGQTFVKLFAKQ